MDEIFHQRFSYEPHTGIIRWKDGKCAGLEAGCVVTNLQGAKYRYVKLAGKMHGAHRVAWLLMTGSWPVEQIDHVNRDGTDNRWENLREATARQNTINRVLPNKSGFRNVYYLPDKRTYQVRIKLGGKRHFIGVFKTLEAAAEAAKEARSHHFGAFAPPTEGFGKWVL